MKNPVQLLQDKLNEVRTESNRLLTMLNESTDIHFRKQMIDDWEIIINHQRVYESHIQILQIWTEL